MNRSARGATHKVSCRSNDDHHRRFIGEVPDGVHGDCFELSLRNLPKDPKLGWSIGSGRPSIDGHLPSDAGVDILLPDTNDDGVADTHAYINWVRGAGGLFLITNNEREENLTLNGDVFSHGRRVVPYSNLILFGECVFRLQYVEHSLEDQSVFHLDLLRFYRRYLHDPNPHALPTPNENDAMLGKWRVQYPISRGTFGAVFAVTHSVTGEPAAMKQIFKFDRNSEEVDREIDMAQHMSTLSHNRIARPQCIIRKGTRISSEVHRIRSQLDWTWDPTAFDVTEEFNVVLPLMNCTFHSLFKSNVSQVNRVVFFSQLMEGVAFLHREQICHRDIKPANILIRSYHPPDVKLSDFGCASYSRANSYDTPVGTILYLAPEQVKGRLHGFPVDYWASALVGTELIGGPRATARVMPGTLLLEDYYIWLDREKSPIASCCRAMMEVHPDQRMTAAIALKRLQKYTAQQEMAERDSYRSLMDLGGKRKADDLD